ncbi:MAG TPA: hypothetical protein PLJ47_05665 [Candidatus Hydrogenedentes bacterium]|nr:hypothetical protein [Candidatus Hydrogenedentota bacterium]
MQKIFFQSVTTMCIAALVVSPGCASTKNVMNKASFGLIGGSEKPDETQTADASAETETKAERKAREKEEKQQREAEKRAAKEQKKARKAAETEETKSADAEEKPGLMNRMTFGLVGGDKEPDEAKQQEADAKAARKEEKRLAKEAREQEEREAKAAKREAEQEEKAQKEQEKLAAKEAKQQEKTAEAEPVEASEAESGEKRTLMSRMTFGLVGGKKSEDTESVTTEETAASEPVESAAPAAVSEPEVVAAEPVTVDAQESTPEATAAPETETASAEPSQPETAEEPKEKRTLMSRMTFGLVGGKGDKAEEGEAADASIPSTEPTEPVEPALPPEQLAMAAPADVQYDVQPEAALGPEERKLAKMPFKTAIDLSTKSASGKGQATATRETYSKNGYGITDIGDVRIAVRDMKFDGESRSGGVVISSDDRAPAGGKSGTGNNTFIYEYAKGVTAVQFGTINFTIANSVISIGGKSVPIGQGKKLIVVDGQGNVSGAYSAE